MFVWTTEGEAGQVSLILGNDENQVTFAHIPESRLGFVCWAEKNANEIWRKNLLSQLRQMENVL